MNSRIRWKEEKWTVAAGEFDSVWFKESRWSRWSVWFNESIWSEWISCISCMFVSFDKVSIASNDKYLTFTTTTIFMILILYCFLIYNINW